MLKAGKLDSKLLESIVFKNITYQRPEVITRPGIGEDCAVVDFGEYECILSTDPITGASDEIGSLAVHISCNDIASNGVAPLGIMLTVLLPVGTTEAEIEKIMRQAGETAKELEVEIIGGHTEITPAVVKPVIISTALGRAKKGASPEAGKIQPGDLMLITKEAGLEGAGIIASDHQERLKGVLSPAEWQEAVAMLSRVSVVKEGVIAGQVGAVAMHDITEGGVLGAVWEMCEIASVGGEVWLKDIPVSPVTQKICRHFDLDWLRLISSGCMLIILRPNKRAEMEKALKEANIPVSCIGEIKPRQAGVYLVADGERTPITPPDSDELYRV